MIGIYRIMYKYEERMHSRNWQMQKLNLEICMYFATAKAPTSCYMAHTHLYHSFSCTDALFIILPICPCLPLSSSLHCHGNVLTVTNQHLFKHGDHSFWCLLGLLGLTKPDLNLFVRRISPPFRVERSGGAVCEGVCEGV